MKKVITVFLLLIMLSICVISNASLLDAAEKAVQETEKALENMEESLEEKNTEKIQIENKNTVENISKIPNTGEGVNIINILISIIIVSIVTIISLFIYNRKRNA